jgi:hypothetical protein
VHEVYCHSCACNSTQPGVCCVGVLHSSPAPAHCATSGWGGVALLLCGLCRRQPCSCATSGWGRTPGSVLVCEGQPSLCSLCYFWLGQVAGLLVVMCEDAAAVCLVVP